MIFIDNRLDWNVRSYYRLDWLSISIAKFYIDWIGLDWIGNPALNMCKNLSTKLYKTSCPLVHILTHAVY